MKVMGFPQLTINGTSTASWGNNRLRVALVVDNTGSMSDDGKMAALIPATKNLLTSLQNAVTTPGDVYVSIIPFVKDVNVDPVNYNQTWIDWTDWNANNGTCSKSGSYNTQSSCTSQNVCSLSGYSSQSSCTSAGTCSMSGYSTQSTCTSAGTCSKSQYTKATATAPRTAGPGLPRLGPLELGAPRPGPRTTTTPGLAA